MTAQNAGPVTDVTAQHEIGFGALLTDPNGLAVAQRQAATTLANEAAQLKSLGWAVLYTPTQTGSYPDYVTYFTAQQGSHLCFVEYSAVQIAPAQTSQQLDIFHT